MDEQNVIYDGFSFEGNGLVLTNIDHLTIAPRKNQLDTLANRNGAVLTQSLLGTKPITIEGYYDGVDAVDAQTMYDTLAAVLNRQQRVLEIPHAGSTRRYTCTPENVILQEPKGLNRLTFSFQFVVPDGSAVDSDSTTLVSATTVTTATATIPLTVKGSVTARPLITIVFNSVTGGTGKTFSLRNSRDFVGLTFSRNFVTGDEIIVDCDNFLIYINGVLAEPSGRIPSWDPGSGALYVGDTFTGRSITITASYNIKNL